MWCWLWHKWSRWEQYEVIMWSGYHKIQYKQYRQKRHCLRSQCNKMEVKEVRQDD
jgi:hypothetical protein